MILARDGLPVLSDDLAWSLSAEKLAPTQVEAMRKRLQEQSHSEPAKLLGKGNKGETLARELVRGMLPESTKFADPKIVDRMFDYRRKRQ